MKMRYIFQLVVQVQLKFLIESNLSTKKTNLSSQLTLHFKGAPLIACSKGKTNHKNIHFLLPKKLVKNK